jgi:hypothetical protein
VVVVEVTFPDMFETVTFINNSQLYTTKDPLLKNEAFNASEWLTGFPL